MKRDLSEKREASNEQLVMMEVGPTFKKKSNEKQFDLNEEVREKLATPLTTSVEKAKEALKEDEALITARQKIIRIVDHSKYGWAMVEEYEEDELVENSDIEK